MMMMMMIALYYSQETTFYCGCNLCAFSVFLAGGLGGSGLHYTVGLMPAEFAMLISAVQLMRYVDRRWIINDDGGYVV